MCHGEKSGTKWNPSLPTPPVGTRSTASHFWLLSPDVPRREEWDGVESVPTNPTGRDAFHRVRFWLLSPDVPRREEWDGVESVPTNSWPVRRADPTSTRQKRAVQPELHRAQCGRLFTYCTFTRKNFFAPAG